MNALPVNCHPTVIAVDGHTSFKHNVNGPSLLHNKSHLKSYHNDIIYHRTLNIIFGAGVGPPPSVGVVKHAPLIKSHVLASRNLQHWTHLDVRIENTDMASGSMIEENQQLVTDEPVEFEKYPVELQDCGKITVQFRGICRINPNLIKENRRM